MVLSQTMMMTFGTAWEREALLSENEAKIISQM